MTTGTDIRNARLNLSHVANILDDLLIEMPCDDPIAMAEVYDSLSKITGAIDDLASRVDDLIEGE